MRRKAFSGIALAGLVWLAVVMFAVAWPVTTAADTRWGAGYFPNVTLTTQDGAPVRFYDDLIKGKIVAISLIYTTCKYACPLETARMAQVAKLLGDRMGKDVFFYSITIDPEHDTPQVLKAYAETFHAGPGWTFLTGKAEDIELISRKLGLYSEPNPANPDGHTPALMIGNESTGQWMRNSATDNAKFLARTIGDWLNSWQTARKPTQSFATAPVLALDRGEYTFRNHCAACHTIGHGDQIGPDLLDVTAKRDHAWLARFIVAPDKVVASGDSIAKELLARYKQLPMPNLGLAPADGEVLIDYLVAQSRAMKHTAPAARETKGGAETRSASLVPIVDPYLRIQEALSANRLSGIGDAARALAVESVTLASPDASIASAAEALQHAADLKAARIAFARLGNAILIRAKSSGSGIGDGVKVAFCPMLQKYWLQKGDAIHNPFYGPRMSNCGRLSSGIPSLKP